MMTIHKEHEWEIEIIEYRPALLPSKTVAGEPETLSFDVYLVHYTQVWQRKAFGAMKKRILIHDDNIKALFYDDAKREVEA